MKLMVRLDLGGGHEAAREVWRTPEADMPGFVPRSRGRCEYRP